ncbi:hypothetical protein Hanom_Chr03g00218861 [Helianthus anomalus]
MYLSDVYQAFTEARRASRWIFDKECFVDPKGNLIVDPDKVDFEALVAAIPTVGVWCKVLEEIPRYREEVEEGIRKVIYANLEKKKKKKKKTVKEIVDESKKMVVEVKKDDEKAVKAVAEKQQVAEEDQIQETKEATVPNTEVTQNESSEILNKSEHKIAEQYKKCMETCRACTKKDNNLRSIYIEFTKIEKIFKEKCNKMIENENFLKEKERELT